MLVCHFRIVRERDVDAASGRDAWSYTLLELADWSEWVLELLPSLRAASETAAEIGASVTGLPSRSGTEVRAVTPTWGARRSRPVNCAVRRATWSWTRRAVSASGAG